MLIPRAFVLIRDGLFEPFIQFDFPWNENLEAYA